MAGTAEQIELINEEVVNCTKCPLSKTRCKAVPGEGSPHALVMFIGEAPGKNEDLQGRPFVGDAGKLLDALLKAIDLKREDVFIANTIKCRPPGNRDPLPSELEICKNYLDRQIAAINPRLIVTLGRISMARYFPGKLISQIHGQHKVEGGRIILPMYHPAAALRDNNGRGVTMAKFKEDGLTIPDLLDKAKEIARTEIWGVGYAGTEDLPASERSEEDTPPLIPPRLQPTLQPAIDTRPGEVTPLTKITALNTGSTVAQPSKNRETEVSEIPASDISVSDTLNLVTSVEIVAAEGISIEGELASKPKKNSNSRVSKANESNSNSKEITSDDKGGDETGKKNSAVRRKKKENHDKAEQLTLF